jgi:hypothetical protein
VPQLICDCGARIEAPVPSHCPGCKRQIVGVPRSRWSLVYPLLLVAAMFAGLIAFFIWYVGKL